MNKTTATRILNAGRNAGINTEYDELRQAVHFYGQKIDSSDIQLLLEEYNGPIDDLVYTSITGNGDDSHIIVSQANRGVT